MPLHVKVGLALQSALLSYWQFTLERPLLVSMRASVSAHVQPRLHSVGTGSRVQQSIAFSEKMLVITGILASGGQREPAQLVNHTEIRKMEANTFSDLPRIAETLDDSQAAWRLQFGPLTGRQP